MSMFCKQSRVKWCKMIVRKVPCQAWIGFYSTPFRVSSKSPTWTSTEVFWRSRLMLTPSFPMIIERRCPSSTCNILEAHRRKMSQQIYHWFDRLTRCCWVWRTKPKLRPAPRAETSLVLHMHTLSTIPNPAVETVHRIWPATAWKERLAANLPMLSSSFPALGQTALLDVTNRITSETWLCQGCQSLSLQRQTSTMPCCGLINKHQPTGQKTWPV